MTKYLFRPPKLIGLYALLSIITYGCSTIIFYAYSWITDATVGMNLAIAYQTTVICAVVFVSLCAFLTLLSIVKRYILFYSTKQLRENVMSSIRSLSLGDFIARDDSYYTSMLLNDLNTVEDDYFANILELIGDSVQLIIMLGVIGQIGIEYLVVVALLCVPSVLQPFIMKKPLGKAGLAVSAQLQEYTGRVREYIYGFEAIKLARRENVFSNLFAVQTGKLEALKKRQAVIGALNGVLLMLAVYGLKVGSQLFFMRQSVVGAISVAVVAMLFGMANNVGNPAANILGYAAAIHSTKEIRSKITGFLSGKNKHDNGSKSLDSPIDEIRLSHVGFSYGDKAVLQDISLSFKRGAKYALVGESGCGKSTLIKLILGYYSDYKGSITINGHDV